MLDVFVGFMDEEVYYTLSTILESKYYDAVYVIERGRAESGGQLFQRPLQDYGSTPMTFVNPAVINVREKDPLLSKLLPNLRRNIDETFSGKRLQGHWTGGGAKLNIYAPEFTVVVFGDKSARMNARRPVVLIRAPEMGKEPSLFRPYLRALMKSLKGIDPGGVNLFVIGAGGSAFPEDSPGKTHVIASSVYAGPQIENDIVWSVVSFVTADSEHKLYRSKVGDVGPENVAEAITRAQNELGKLKSEESSGRRALLGHMKKIPQDLVDSGRVVSLTTGFFSGAAEKAAAASLGLRDVNMEDFHVLKVVNSMRPKARAGKALEYPRIGAAAVFRVDCDPFKIATDEVEALNAWLKDTKNSSVPVKDMVEIIEFGLLGLPLHNVPSAMEWSFPGVLRRTERFLPYGRRGGQPLILDPFRLEVASDLLAEAANRNAFQGRQPGDDELREVLANLAGMIRSSSSGMPADPITKLSQGPYGQAIEKMTSALKKSGKSRRLLIESFIELLSQRLAPGAGDRKPIWIRQGKWPLKNAQTKPVTQAELQLDASGVDRAYYKASNLPGLRDLNQDVVGQSVHAYLEGRGAHAELSQPSQTGHAKHKSRKPKGKAGLQ